MLAAIVLGAGLASAAGAATPPSRMMANVYLLAEAGAMIDICVASDAFKSLPAERGRSIRDLDRRLMEVVRAIGKHYGEEALDGTYAATKARIATDPRLKFHQRNNYATCGDHLIDQLAAYVAENESMIGQYFRGQAPGLPPAAAGKK
jgi:hypothetical protein